MEDKKVALITGITGQDGKFIWLSFLLKKDYVVHGNQKKNKPFLIQIGLIISIKILISKIENLILHYGDMTDSMKPHSHHTRCTA